MRSDRGTALIEFAVILPLMVMLAIGAFEWGVGFRDQISVSQSVREAARVGGAVGDRSDADCAILEAGAGALSAIGGHQVKEMWIYKSNVDGDVGANRQIFRPAQPTDNPASLKCSGGWYPIEQTWAPTTRDNSGPIRDWLGVRVVLDHEWKTDFLWWSGSTQWQESTVVHLEPEIVS